MSVDMMVSRRWQAAHRMYQRERGTSSTCTRVHMIGTNLWENNMSFGGLIPTWTASEALMGTPRIGW